MILTGELYNASYELVNEPEAAVVLKDEEGHINFLETQLQLLASIGEERYGLLNAASAEDAD